MKKWSLYAALAFQTVLIQSNICAQQLTLLKKTNLSHYPSSSAIEFYNNRLYVIGDDATHMLLLDADHNVMDSVVLFNGAEKRLSKDEKADIEALTIIQKRSEPSLLAISSFSTSKRKTLLQMPLANVGHIKRLQNNKLIKKLKKAGISQPNIEAIAAVNDFIVLGNRANNSSPYNQLILVKNPGKLHHIKSNKIHNLSFPKSQSIVGLSGLTYLPQKDMLLFTASTEETNSVYADGAIGESYLGYVSEFSEKMSAKNITADKLLPLSKMLNGGLQKIESVCVESYNDKQIVLHLASDNDNGQSSLFKIALNF